MKSKNPFDPEKSFYIQARPYMQEKGLRCKLGFHEWLPTKSLFGDCGELGDLIKPKGALLRVRTCIKCHEIEGEAFL